MCLFFFNDTATTEIYTLSLHDALPIFALRQPAGVERAVVARRGVGRGVPIGPGHPELRAAADQDLDRKSTRLNSSHANISYAVFCLKKKKMLSRLTTHTHVLKTAASCI